MFDLLCIISMALCNALVLVHVGIFSEFFIHPSCPSWGGFHVTFQDRYFLFYSVIVFGHKSLEALPVRRALLSEVLTTRRLKRYFNRRSTKQQWQVHPGDTFQPQGLTPTPMTRRTSSIFSPGRSSRRFGPFFSTLTKKPKHSK